MGKVFVIKIFNLDGTFSWLCSSEGGVQVFTSLEELNPVLPKNLKYEIVEVALDEVPLAA